MCEICVHLDQIIEGEEMQEMLQFLWLTEAVR